MKVLCEDVIEIMPFFIEITKGKEGRTFYLKMLADYQRYLIDSKSVSNKK
jgi:hypothetical protein